MSAAQIVFGCAYPSTHTHMDYYSIFNGRKVWEERGFAAGLCENCLGYRNVEIVAAWEKESSKERKAEVVT